MNNDLLKLSKNELVALLVEMKQKLIDLQQVEKKVTQEEKDLPHIAMGCLKNDKGLYELIELRYDRNGGACVTSVTNLESHDYAIAMYQAKKMLVEQIMSNARKS